MLESTMAESEDHSSPLARHDLWSGLALALLGLAVAFESWRMPRLEERGIDPWTIPGIVPGVLGAALAVLGAVLCRRGYRQSRVGFGQAAARAVTGTGDGRRRFFVALVLNLAYALLVGRLPFWLATLGYLLAFMTIFGWEARDGGVARSTAIHAMVAAAATAGIVYLFQTLFLVRLP